MLTVFVIVFVACVVALDLFSWVIAVRSWRRAIAAARDEGFVQGTQMISAIIVPYVRELGGVPALLELARRMGNVDPRAN